MQLSRFRSKVDSRASLGVHQHTVQGVGLVQSTIFDSAMIHKNTNQNNVLDQYKTSQHVNMNEIS